MCLGGEWPLGEASSVLSERFDKPLGWAAEHSLESGPPCMGLSLCTVLCVLLCAILQSTSLKGFATE